MIKLYCSVIILFGFTASFIQGSKNSNNVIKSLFKTRVNRVDSGVKRPVRFCQGFEDPAEIDCYMRSDVKPYVCTESVSFNPCESLQRVNTYHYDHIIHRCIKVNVPACEGQIIRVLTLLQCLIYCHNKDPFALGKSRSMVYKLNQPKPYVPHEKLENERKKIFKINNQKKSLVDQGSIQTEVKEKSSKPVVKVIENSTPESQTVITKTGTINNIADENIDEDIFARTLNKDSDLANYLINGEPNLLGKKFAPSRALATTKELTKSLETDVLTKADEKGALEKSGEIKNVELKNINKEAIKSQEQNQEPINEENTNEKKNEIQNAELKNINEEAIKSQAQNQEPTNEENTNEKKSQSEQTDIVNDEKTEKTSFKTEISMKKKRVENVSINNYINESKIPKEENKTDSRDKSKDDGFYLWDE